MIISNGESKYESTYQNGIQSVSFGAAPRSFTFKSAPKVNTIKCSTNSVTKEFNLDVGEKLSATCPDGCTRKDVTIFGTDLYTQNSAVCQAAIHAGLMTDLGGEVSWVIVPSPSVFLASTRGHLASQKADGDESPFAIKFIGSKKNTCKFFEEDYVPAVIFKNWAVVDAKSALNGPSQWTFTKDPTDFGLVIKQNT